MYIDSDIIIFSGDTKELLTKMREVLQDYKENCAVF